MLGFSDVQVELGMPRGESCEVVAIASLLLSLSESSGREREGERDPVREDGVAGRAGAALGEEEKEKNS
eukprot:scaffold197023_cov35-Tisochrysis_lutea.AAC.1